MGTSQPSSLWRYHNSSSCLPFIEFKKQEETQAASLERTNVEIIVTEGDQEGAKIAALVREIDASALVVGLHDHSFLHKVAMSYSNIASNFNCRVLAIKQPAASPQLRTQTSAATMHDSSTNMDFSQIEIARLEVPDIPPQKIPYRICPNPSAIIWRSRKSRRKRSS